MSDLTNSGTAQAAGRAAAVRFSGRTVFCKDMPRVAQFYEEVLGFGRAFGDDEHLGLTAPVDGATDATVLFLLHEGEPAGGTDLGTFAVDDVDTITDKVRQAGFTVNVEPNDQPWGREAAICDPEGNGLYLLGPTKGADTP